MKRSLCALFLCAVLLLCAVLPAAAATPNVALTFQAGTASMLVNGSAQEVSAPFYAPNGVLLVPLRPVADQLGAALSWDAPSRQATLRLDGSTLRFTDRSWRYEADGVEKTLGTYPRVAGGTFCVPAVALADLGISVRLWGYDEGGFCLISRQALPESEQDQCRQEALAAFGPNEGLFRKTTLALRLGSRMAWTGGQTVALCDKGGSAVPEQGSDGFLMIPLQACAEALGGTYTQNEDGTATVALNGHTAVFPGVNGYLTVDGARKEHAYFGGAVRQGTVFCSAYAFAAGLGYHCSAQGDALLLTACDLSKRPELEAQAWQAARSLTPQRYEDAKGFLALTFDDGPSGSITTRLLDGLKARGVHATFFVCNYRIQTFPGLMGRYLAEGHEVGNHSANHATLTACGPDKLASELDATSASITRLCGAAPTLMRPPGGASNGTVLSAAGSRGMSCILWSVDTLDWKNRNVSAILQRTLGTVRDGDIILMHDMYNTSVDAALSMIDTLQAQGYVFVTVSELAQLKGTTLTPGVSYSSIR